MTTTITLTIHHLHYIYIYIIRHIPGATICVTGTLSTRLSNVGIERTFPQSASTSETVAV